MTLTTLRRTIPDSTILDWLELRQVFGRAFTIRQLCDHWQLTQPAACRRAHRLEAAGLARPAAVGWPRQWRLMLRGAVGRIAELECRVGLEHEHEKAPE